MDPCDLNKSHGHFFSHTLLGCSKGTYQPNSKTFSQLIIQKKLFKGKKLTPGSSVFRNDHIYQNEEEKYRQARQDNITKIPSSPSRDKNGSTTIITLPPNVVFSYSAKKATPLFEEQQPCSNDEYAVTLSFTETSKGGYGEFEYIKHPPDYEILSDAETNSGRSCQVPVHKSRQTGYKYLNVVKFIGTRQQYTNKGDIDEFDHHLRMSKQHVLCSRERSARLVPETSSKNEMLPKRTLGITNNDVLSQLIRRTLQDLEDQGVFPTPKYPMNQMKHTFSTLPLRPIPIYPLQGNIASNQDIPSLSVINTYRDWPNDSIVSPSTLARAGFQCSNSNSNTVCCLSCGLHADINDFTNSDPLTFHSRRSPLCTFLRRENVSDETAGSGNGLLESNNEARDVSTISPNIPTEDSQGAIADVTNTSEYAPRNPDQCLEVSRRESFRNWPGRSQDIDILASAGFFFTGEEDIVRCFHCDIGLAEWDSDDDPWVEHARHSPDCPFLREKKDGDFIMNIQRRWAQIYTPKHPHMCQMNMRLESYGPSWPQDYVTQTPQQLAEAGLFYTGVTDTVRCHYCDGGLREWEPNDDPWTEHARWFPFCKFVIKVKGPSFIQSAARHEDTDEAGETLTAISQPPVIAEPTFEEKYRIRDLENPMMSAAVESVKIFGYKRRMIKKAINARIEESGTRDLNAAELMDCLFELEEKESSLETDEYDSYSSSDEFKLSPKAMASENNYLKTRNLCVECRQSERCILFVSCGHRVTCEPCGMQRTSCPICSVEVTKRLKTFLG
ncbi:E3 ubiquitin-protein ligase XIAP-like [Ylistrum balloti]|uniref:E3 ubiquitin-protein ligase XIAP-like n=1 Tax=Ylistrum balloti TaxID=509963 RepID=UPI002905908A|nr:E3 ubiquitin-protein ligase XIAP-like [Ylistrum balloti]